MAVGVAEVLMEEIKEEGLMQELQGESQLFAQCTCILLWQGQGARVGFLGFFSQI